MTPPGGSAERMESLLTDVTERLTDTAMIHLTRPGATPQLVINALIGAAINFAIRSDQPADRVQCAFRAIADQVPRIFKSYADALARADRDTEGEA